MKPISQWGFIYAPNARSRAYLSLFDELDIIPNVIIRLEGELRESSALSAESARFNYQRFYDVDFTLEAFTEKHSTELRSLRTRKISDKSAFDAMNLGGVDAWIFGGGGIVPKQYFGVVKPILHVHPGVLPEYRGSTCWYYSYLEKREVGATAFWMSPELDNGEMVCSQTFRINMGLASGQSLFLDHVLDPYIRRCVLRKALLLKGHNEIDHEDGVSTGNEAYFVAHPWIRHLMKRRLKAQFVSGMISDIE